ncbi:MAG: NADH dehydrogenase (quinone) subunit D [Ignavibacteria bacterium GWA2_55_11]|nr:MAG: NADH dehydrogenase (quinone) subunit D [Ignavibacteria bacterium GWA2_55_11]OGU69778.1 MAG: NADH dehydrogenase (quinone) subunit D [Ignavibacteria bacterium RIFCSPLOWO2_02_FULL_55_14]OGU73233.1 MAG: NADH dehydrogenase (quinone) subunit D [Ignavibacteria bacterium RIFCSPLOWO2_12_FULL_56_21]
MAVHTEEPPRRSRILQALEDQNTNVQFDDALESEMILNMGPQHPATHGVLRLLVKLDGERVIGCVPELGYLHRGYEKLAENCSYHEFIPHTDRLDYLSPLSNNTAYVLAVEKLLGIEAPPRAQHIRTIITELARISSHLLWLGSMGMDVGALTVFMWTFREREKLYDVFEHIVGARFTTSYTRIGGLAHDLLPEPERMIRDYLADFLSNLDECERLLNRNRIFVERTDGIGPISTERAIDLGLTGPNLRACGVQHDLRRAQPYLIYKDLDFEVPTQEGGDTLARYYVRMAEMKESYKIICQALDRLPMGDIHAFKPKKVLPRKDRVYTRMEELIHDFMIVNFGVEPPVGEVYHAVEAPKGELGFYFYSHGEGQPWRMKIRSPSFVNLQSLPTLVQGAMISDVVAIIGSLDPVMGEADK